MYQHADQTWKNKPRKLSETHQKLFANRLKEYACEKSMKRLLVVFHGGEPLLFGAENLVHFAKQIRKSLEEAACTVDFGIQTNGVLLKEEHLEMFNEENISVSLSLDGPKEMHDAHRLDMRRKPTFDRVHAALKLLQKYPKIFQGCIAVVNPNFKAKSLFQFFEDNGIEDFNILIPDANYIAPPEGRDKNPNLYKNWLIEAFDCWFDEYPHLRCKYFDWMLKAALGHVSETDSFGLGDICLLVLETDGTYHNHDVLKITEEHSSDLGFNLENNAIIEAESSEKIQFHRHLLTKEGLSAKCQECKFVNVCGGGFIAHRFDGLSYKNPSVYCNELYSLFDHIFQKIQSQINETKNKTLLPEFTKEEIAKFFASKTSESSIDRLIDHRARKNYAILRSIIPYALRTFPDYKKWIESCGKKSYEELKEVLLEPTTSVWLRAFYGQSIQTPSIRMDGKALPADPAYFETIVNFERKSDSREFNIQVPNPWYQLVIGDHIILDHEKGKFEGGLRNLKQALELIRNYDPCLFDEMLNVSRHIQLIVDKNAFPDKDVSFSDMAIPGAIFIGTWKSSGLLSPYVVAASLIHEHLHQKLYLFQNRFELFERQVPWVFSPWPNVLRPPNGVLHAVYVFTHVAHFWQSLLQKGEAIETASEQYELEMQRLDRCIHEIREKVAFTQTGEMFFDCVLKKFQSLKNEEPSILV